MNFKFATALLAGSVLTLSVLWVKSRIEIIYINDQLNVFTQLGAMSFEATDVRLISDNLAYILNYHHSGSRFEAGSAADKIVEAARTAIAKGLVSRLQLLTGRHDIGTDPKKWIDEYSTYSNASRAGLEPLRRRE